MSTLTFDTLKYAKRLQSAGVPGPQAEAEAEALADVLAEAAKASDMATKADVQNLELKIAETKTELIRWVVGAGFLQTALITALLLKLLPH